MSSRALIVVDVQNDFVEGGSLAVSGGMETGYRINEYLMQWHPMYKKIIFTKDWHNAPPSTNGGHFSDTPDYEKSWPVHCVADTHGAEFVPAVAMAYNDLRNADVVGPLDVFYKGQGRPDYSGFQGRNTDGVKLVDYLDFYEIYNLDIVGIAGDFCVKETAYDALNDGFKVNLLPDLIVSVGGYEATLETINLVL